MNRRDQANQAVLQTRSARSTTAAYKDARRLLQKRTRALKSDWWERKAVELQRAADSNNIKGFYNGLKEVWDPKKKGPVQLKLTDGMETYSDSKRVVARWSEHFQKLLNVSGDIDHEALDNIPIYKKGDRTDCGNYRGISLLSIAGKIFARILLNRLSTHNTPEIVPETQCGFRGNRSTVYI